MRTVTTQRYQPPKQRRPIFRLAWYIVLLALLVGISFHYLKKPASTNMLTQAHSVTLSDAKLAWPDTGEAALQAAKPLLHSAEQNFSQGKPGTLN